MIDLSVGRDEECISPPEINFYAEGELNWMNILHINILSIVICIFNYKYEK